MDPLAIGIAAILGAIMGSFSMAVAWRAPRGVPWVSGRSCCPHCGTRLTARDLVPILSWLAAGGRARCCGGIISWRYPLSEAAGAAAFALPVVMFGQQPEVVVFFALWTLLAVISLIDLSHLYIPDMAVAGVWLVGIASDLLGLSGPVEEGLSASCIAVVALLSVRYLAGRFAGREALGLGDVKLFAASGPWVGLQGMPVLVFASAGVALLFYPLWRRRGGAVGMPFGPAIAVTLYVIACLTAT